MIFLMKIQWFLAFILWIRDEIQKIFQTELTETTKLVERIFIVNIHFFNMAPWNWFIYLNHSPSLSDSVGVFSNKNPGLSIAAVELDPLHFGNVLLDPILSLYLEHPISIFFLKGLIFGVGDLSL